ncbi:Brix domain-containing protein [Linnemannia elongata]|nr:rRNA-binding ribosome biosynthesis protein rpf2 [Linnemannia elongata]KAG0051352.1 rRNA-binding ribosome biosynthesis protein rpf2 [Linnemannia elongata]KAG0061747.1 rRNA-binding ribosome biosynthesis protein rpf2 [Linnemannia elongata]KAH7051431.1 Brix domain-containing protein [Linnemannia elongata]KAK5815775.1 Brix domain-containing protein [Linnemannia elongata]
MLRTITPRNARVKRVLKNREAKTEENIKTAIFIRGSQTSQIVNDALADLYMLKKPYAVNFTKKNQIHPFEDHSNLQFFSQKNDASLFVIGTHSKKRPNTLTFARMFDHQLLDMMEVSIEKGTPMKDFKTPKSAIGMKPCFMFNGDMWDQNPHYIMFKSMILDFYHGQTVDKVALAGLEYVISVTSGPMTSEGKPGKIYLRTYTIVLKRSGVKLPRIELVEMGPSMDMTFGRMTEAKPDVWKQSLRVPKELKPKKKKNITKDVMGDTVGRIHLGKQDFDKIQTRKMKGLKKRTASTEDDKDSSEKKQRVDESDDEE